MLNIMRRVATLIATFAILGASLGGTALADNQPTTTTASPSISVQLPAGGGWASYTFWYDGFSAVDQLAMTYNPADLSTDQYVSLVVYAPGVIPAGNNTIGAGTLLQTSGAPAQSGIKTWQLTAVAYGTYTVMVQNWDSKGRQVTANVSSIDVASGGAGPALTLVGSSSGVTSTNTGGPTPSTPAPQPVVSPTATPAPAPAPASGSTASVTLHSGGAWASYTFSYPGDGSGVLVTMNYNPGDVLADQSFTLEAYPPGVVPDAIDAVGAGTVYHNVNGIAFPGMKTWQLNSTTTPGIYTLFVQNWDAQGRTISAQLSTSELTSLDTPGVATGVPGPALTLIGSGG